MKTKEIPFSTIETIKRNNKLSEQLATIEKIAEDIYYNYLQVDNMEIQPVQKYLGMDEFSTDDFNASNFVYAIMRFAEINQIKLQENSQNLIK
jgi:hypothetical protein